MHITTWVVFRCTIFFGAVVSDYYLNIQCPGVDEDRRMKKKISTRIFNKACEEIVLATRPS